MNNKGFRYYSSQLPMDEVNMNLANLDSAKSQFLFMRQCLSEHGMLPTTMKLINRYYNEPLFSIALRHQGNELFIAKQYLKANAVYTECLRGCKKYSECFALALGNRSATWFYMNDYQTSLCDAYKAMVSNYPSQLIYKLYNLAGRAEQKLGNFERAKKYYTKCLTQLDKKTKMTDGKRKLRAEVELALIECEKLFQPKITAAEQLLGGQNNNIPALSAHLELKLSKHMRRGVYATRDINPGDVVAIDEPYFCWPIPYNTEVCHYNGCLKIDISLIPCPECFLVSYCSIQCMENANKEGHYLECKIMHFISSIPGIPDIKEVAIKWFLKDYLKMGFEKYCLMVDNFSNSEVDPVTRGFNESGQYKSDNFLTAYSLDCNENKITIANLFFYNCIAAQMLQYLILKDLKVPVHCIGIVGASLVRILIVVDANFNKFFINEPNRRLEDSELMLALTLYPTISLFNHSCDPNITCSGNIFDNKKVMKAIQPIPKGSQLCTTYGLSFNQNCKKFRKHTSQIQFKFECYCQPCQENWPTFGFIPNSLSALNLLNLEMADIVTSECLKFEKFKNSVNKEDYSQHLDYLYSFIRLLFNNVKRPFELYEECLETIRIAHLNTTHIYNNCNHLKIKSASLSR